MKQMRVVPNRALSIRPNPSNLGWLGVLRSGDVIDVIGEERTVLYSFAKFMYNGSVAYAAIERFIPAKQYLEYVDEPEPVTLIGLTGCYPDGDCVDILNPLCSEVIATFSDFEIIVLPVGQAPTEPPVEEPQSFSFVVPDTGNFVYMNHDWGSKYWNYQPRSAKINLDVRPGNGDLPDTGKGKIDRFNPLSEAWQFFWRDIMRHFAPDMHDVYDPGDYLSFPAAWESMTAESRALTDNHAAENGFINYPSKANLTNPMGKGVMQIKELTFGGNILKVISETADTYIVEAFDPSLPPPTVEVALRDTPHLIQWATTSQCYRIDDKWDGVESAKPFPQIRDSNNVRTGSPFPLIGLGGMIEFRKTHSTKKCLDLVPVANGAEYSPYKKRPQAE